MDSTDNEGGGTLDSLISHMLNSGEKSIFNSLLSQLREVADACLSERGMHRNPNIQYWDKISGIASQFKARITVPFFKLHINSTDPMLSANREYIFKNPANLHELFGWLFIIRSDQRTKELRTLTLGLEYIQDQPSAMNMLAMIPPQILGCYDDPMRTRKRILADFANENVPDVNGYIFFMHGGLTAFLESDEEIAPNQQALAELERADQKELAQLIDKADQFMYTKKRKD